MNHVYPMPVPENRRVECASRRFGALFATRVEPAIYSWASALAPLYRGGYWSFFCLSNGGFYMAPAHESLFEVRAPNGFDGRLSADALGVAACMYAFSHGAFHRDEAGAGAEACSRHFHLLRDLAIQHRERDAILSVID